MGGLICNVFELCLQRRQDKTWDFHGYMYDEPRSRVKSSSLLPTVLVIKVKYMYHTEVSPNPTNGNADTHESGALPFLSLPSSFAASIDGMHV
jgi:hypothetical protein